MDQSLRSVASIDELSIGMEVYEKSTNFKFIVQEKFNLSAVLVATMAVFAEHMRDWKITETEDHLGFIQRKHFNDVWPGDWASHRKDTRLGNFIIAAKTPEALILNKTIVAQFFGENSPWMIKRDDDVVTHTPLPHDYALALGKSEEELAGNRTREKISSNTLAGTQFIYRDELWEVVENEITQIKGYCVNSRQMAIIPDDLWYTTLIVVPAFFAKTLIPPNLTKG